VKTHGLVTMKLKSVLEASVWKRNPLLMGGTCVQISVGLFVLTERIRYGFAPVRVSTEQASATSGV
jgi:hypothetical protein